VAVEPGNAHFIAMFRCGAARAGTVVWPAAAAAAAAAACCSAAIRQFSN